MATCKQCGASVELNQQCPGCGSFYYGDDGVLDLDEGALVASHQPGVAGDRPNQAQIGAISTLDLGDREPPPGPAVRARPVASGPSFAEQERARRLLYWRVTRIPVLLILGWFTASHLFLGARWVFIDNFNLLIHEAGHPLFSWGGDTLHALGGTLAQLILPALFAVYFGYWRRQWFAMVVGIWWVGENLMPISLYMDDAVVQELPLVGGGTHDWGYLFAKWGVLESTNEIASFFHWVGILTMLGCMLVLIWWTVKPTQWELESGGAPD